MEKDEEYVALYLEKETAKIRSELFKENHALRLELERLKSDSAGLLKDVESKISSAENKIAEKAIDKMFAFINQVKNWIGVAALVLTGIITLSAFIGYKNITDVLVTSFKDRVDKWMRFDDEQSEGRKTLDELRTEAIINAYMIRLARDYSRVSESFFPINGPEEKLLLEIIEAPQTRYRVFSDALLIVSKNRGPFRFVIEEDDVGKRIAALLTVEQISSDKKMLVLERMKGDGALLPYSTRILNDAEQNIAVRMAAFENVKVFKPDSAKSFAEQNVGSAPSNVKSELILYLASVSGIYEPALKYIRELVKEKPEYWQSNVIQVVAQLGETLTPTVEPTAYKLADLFIPVVELGGKVNISDALFGPKHVAMQLGGASTSLKKPGRILKDPALVKAILTQKGDDVDWLTKGTDFFQVSDNGTLLSTLIATPGARAQIGTEDASQLTVQTVSGDIWLRTQSLPGGQQLLATWRDKTSGIVHTEKVISISNAQAFSYKISFDEKLLESLTYDYRSVTDHL